MTHTIRVAMPVAADGTARAVGADAGSGNAGLGELGLESCAAPLAPASSTNASESQADFIRAATGAD